jgi:Domain of unknown function (DUF3576)
MKSVADYVQIGELTLRNLFFFFLFTCLSACSYLSSTGKDVEYVQDPFNPNKTITKKEAEKIGTLDLNFIKKDDKPDGYQEKNYFLWSACVDVLSNLPPKISDAAGGIYTTEYVPAKDNTKQSIQCSILGDKVLSNNITVTIFSIKSDGTHITPYENNELKSNILIRAKELKAQYDDTL